MQHLINYICCVPFLEELVENFIGLHHSPCTLQMCFRATANTTNELQEFYAIL